MIFRGISYVLLIASLGLTTACAYTISESQKSTVRTCQIPADQTNTFLGQWTVKPVPLAFAAGQFSSGEIAQIKKGVDVWNKHFMAVRGATVFDYTTASAGPAQAPAPAALCAQASVQGSSFITPMTIYKQGNWLPSLKDVIAITSTCPSLDAGLPKFTNAMMELNYQYFFVTNQVPDLATIIVHELGHMAGLNHSCETSGKNNNGQAVPNCTATNLAQSYYEAVMFPVVNFSNGVGVPKTAINSNDQGRVNCLFN